MFYDIYNSTFIVCANISPFLWKSHSFQSHVHKLPEVCISHLCRIIIWTLNIQAVMLSIAIREDVCSMDNVAKVFMLTYH